jgi:hypothetical protein
MLGESRRGQRWGGILAKQFDRCLHQQRACHGDTSNHANQVDIITAKNGRHDVKTNGNQSGPHTPEDVYS